MQPTIALSTRYRMREIKEIKCFLRELRGSKIWVASPGPGVGAVNEAPGGLHIEEGSLSGLTLNLHDLKSEPFPAPVCTGEEENQGRVQSPVSTGQAEWRRSQEVP